MPRREEPGERVLLDRLDLAAQRRERPPAELAQHVDVTPLPGDTLGTELADDEPLLPLQRGQRAGDRARRHTEAAGDVVGDERGVRARIPTDE